MHSIGGPGCTSASSGRAAFILAMAVLNACTPTDPNATLSSTKAARTVSDEMGFIMNALISEAITAPSHDVLRDYAVANHWRVAPQEELAVIHAKSAYVSKLGDQLIIVSSDGTNDVFAVTTNKQFSPASVRTILGQAFLLHDEESEDSSGQRTELISIADHGKAAGYVTLTYGLAPAIRGTGTVGYMSVAKVKEGLAEGGSAAK